MTKQLNMFSSFADQQLTEEFRRERAVPIARSSDPVTSHQAASSVAPKMNNLRELVLKVAVENIDSNQGSFTARELGELCSEIHGGEVETYRKRVREVANAGELEEFGVRTCRFTGKRATVFVLPDKD